MVVQRGYESWAGWESIVTEFRRQHPGLILRLRSGESYDEMFDFMSRTVARVFSLVEVGIAFNVMSKHVDWERHDLFPVPFDEMAAFLIAHVTRNIVLRADYGLYEYTAYAYH